MTNTRKNQPGISPDTARLIAREEAAAAVGKHEQSCGERYREISGNLEQIWRAIDAARGRAWTIVLWIVAGLITSVIGLVAYIYTQTPPPGA